MLNWEEIKQNTAGSLQRVKVPNGWLVREVHEVHIELGEEKGFPPILQNYGYEWTSSITFVPDAEHKWEIDK